MRLTAGAFCARYSTATPPPDEEAPAGSPLLLVAPLIVKSALLTLLISPSALLAPLTAQSLLAAFAGYRMPPLEVDEWLLLSLLDKLELLLELGLDELLREDVVFELGLLALDELAEEALDKLLDDAELSELLDRLERVDVDDEESELALEVDDELSVLFELLDMLLSVEVDELLSVDVDELLSVDVDELLSVDVDDRVLVLLDSSPPAV